jgi:hypothetical protein
MGVVWGGGRFDWSGCLAGCLRVEGRVFGGLGSRGVGGWGWGLLGLVWTVCNGVFHARFFFSLGVFRHVHTHMHIHTRARVCKKHTHIHICIHIDTHTHIYICIYTYQHTQENARLLQSLYDEETARFEAAMYKVTDAPRSLFFVRACHPRLRLRHVRGNERSSVLPLISPHLFYTFIFVAHIYIMYIYHPRPPTHTLPPLSLRFHVGCSSQTPTAMSLSLSISLVRMSFGETHSTTDGTQQEANHQYNPPPQKNTKHPHTHTQNTNKKMMRRLKEEEGAAGRAQEAGRVEREQLQREYEARLQAKEAALAAATEGKAVLLRRLEEEGQVGGGGVGGGGGVVDGWWFFGWVSGWFVGGASLSLFLT